MSNPFETPQANLTIEDDDEVVRVRKANLHAEDRLRSAGAWAASEGVLVLFMTIVVYRLVPYESMFDTQIEFAGMVGSAVGGVLLMSGIGLIRLRAVSRLPALIATLPPVLILPIPGVFVAIWVAYATLSRKGAYVLSAEYQRVRRQTPDLDPRFAGLTAFTGPAFAMLILFGLGAAFAWWRNAG